MGQTAEVKLFEIHDHRLFLGLEDIAEIDPAYDNPTDRPMTMILRVASFGESWFLTLRSALQCKQYSSFGARPRRTGGSLLPQEVVRCTGPRLAMIPLPGLCSTSRP